MKRSIHPAPEVANQAAADLLWGWLTAPETRNVMVAAGNTPLELYRIIGERRSKDGSAGKSSSPIGHLNIFMLDEYVGVPRDEPRNCANLLRRSVVEAWGIPAAQYYTVSSEERDALESVRAHERNIRQSGGLDVIILGLGQNGHLGFNEPGSAEDSEARMLDLQPVSIEANRQWFGGDYAPAKGATVGLKTILGARHVIVLAYGSHKTAAVAAMVEGQRGPACPASFLQGHPETHLFLDTAAAAGLRAKS
jgi:glucosamine-6-phosphate deaminase